MSTQGKCYSGVYLHISEDFITRSFMYTYVRIPAYNYRIRIFVEYKMKTGCVEVTSYLSM